MKNQNENIGFYHAALNYLAFMEWTEKSSKSLREARATILYNEAMQKFRSYFEGHIVFDNDRLADFFDSRYGTAMVVALRESECDEEFIEDMDDHMMDFAGDYFVWLRHELSK